MLLGRIITHSFHCGVGGYRSTHRKLIGPHFFPVGQPPPIQRRVVRGLQGHVLGTRGAPSPAPEVLRRGANSMSLLVAVGHSFAGLFRVALNGEPLVVRGTHFRGNTRSQRPPEWHRENMEGRKQGFVAVARLRDRPSHTPSSAHCPPPFDHRAGPERHSGAGGNAAGRPLPVHKSAQRRPEWLRHPGLPSSRWDSSPS